jgi:adenosine/AMP kinase
MDAKIHVVALTWQESANIVGGQSHFIKTAEDLAEIMNSSVPGAEIRAGFLRGIRALPGAQRGQRRGAGGGRCATAVGAGHTFFLVMKNAYPINVLNQVKSFQEVCRIFGATANPLQVLVGATDQGRGILGLIDGFPPKGVECDADKADRRRALATALWATNNGSASAACVKVT